MAAVVVVVVTMVAMETEAVVARVVERAQWTGRWRWQGPRHPSGGGGLAVVVVKWRWWLSGGCV